MSIRPLHDRIIVQCLEASAQAGHIILPDSAKEKPPQGKVIAAGNGRYADDGARVPLDVKGATSSCSASSPARRSGSMARTTSSCARTTSWR